jgi:hypothetical protein
MNERARVSYSVKEAAASVGCSVDVIRAAIANGNLTPRYITKTLRVIEADDLRRWVAEAPTEKAS